MARGSGIVVRSTWRSFANIFGCIQFSPQCLWEGFSVGDRPFTVVSAGWSVAAAGRCHLQCCHQLLRKQPSLGDGPYLVHKLTRVANFTRCNHIWLYHRCLWKGQSLARSILAVSVHAGRCLETRHYHMQRLDQLMLHVCSVGCGHACFADSSRLAFASQRCLVSQGHKKPTIQIHWIFSQWSPLFADNDFLKGRITGLTLHDQHVDGAGGWGCHRLSQRPWLFFSWCILFAIAHFGA